MRIRLTRKSETLCYAASELAKYLLMIDETLAPEIVCERGEDGITLGLLSELGLSCEGVDDAMIDDVIDVKVCNLSGYIAGSNERSVLMGVYNYLKSAGCKWVRPGEDGEFIPYADMREHGFTWRKKADFAFRGECIEGAVSFEHVRDTILWLPKVNMNMFMMEQIVPYNYMSRWYKHEVSTVKQDEQVSFEQVGEYVRQLEATIKKCGLQLHALGHGYLLEPYGIHYKTSGDKYELNDRAREEIALVNGKRELFCGSPNFTQICMSNDRARRGQVEFLVSYLEKKPYIDFLHVWLSDSVNNHCECENCQKRTPSDFYVQLLNELDAELSARGIDTKIVFIMYTDTLWAPERERLQHPERFIMTTATSRDYGKPYSTARYKGDLPPYRRNDFRIELGFDLTLSFMDAWRSAFSGRRFLYEYYMYTDHFFDPGYMSISRHILDDIRHLEEVGFEGIMSDQTQRSFFPTGLPMSLIGEAQFDKSLDFDRFADDYFKACFGNGWMEALEYLDRVSEIFDPDMIRARDSVVSQDTGAGGETRSYGVKNNPSVAHNMEALPLLVESFSPYIEQGMQMSDPCRRRSWQLLFHHADYILRLSRTFVALSRGDTEAARENHGAMIDHLSRIEDEIAPQFDLVLFNQRIKQIIKAK